jgi:sigma-B regulation protein RsbU (phosphoserine phosphatase)
MGLVDGAAFPSNRARLSPGEELVLYTDGVSEALSEDGELFGPERLLEAVAGAAAGGAGAVTDALLHVVRRFAGTAAQSDDITILTLEHRPSRARDA